ncbi:MAG: RNA methyltransferase [Candidatus Pacebacteria bacterium]|nr:RNA methyltransferase [Candidatus Paceibacterota bacterium]
MIKIRNKNAIYELLIGDVAFEKIVILAGLEQDDLTKAIVSEANKRQIPIENTPYSKMAKRRDRESREAVLGILKRKESITLKKLLGNLYEKDKEPFFLLLEKVDYSTNIGTIARTAFAAGVNGLIFQKDMNLVFNEDTIQFSIGAIARIPLVKMNIFEALKELKKNGIKIFTLDMEGSIYSNEDLKGPTAFVLGSEKEGVSDNISNRCDNKLSIPMKRGIDSLNVGSATSIILYEKVRQEGKGFFKKV